MNDVHRHSDAVIDSYPLGEPIAPPPPPSNPPVVAAQAPPPPTPLCPCRSRTGHDLSTREKLQRETAKSHTLCILRNEHSDYIESNHLTDHLNTNIVLLSKDVTTEYERNATSEEVARVLRLTECDVLLRIVNGTGHASTVNHRQCPGVCVPVPFLEVPWTLLQTPLEGAGASSLSAGLHNASLTCSLTVGAAHAHAEAVHTHHHTGAVAGEKAHRERSLGFLLRTIARRRLEECTERGLWPLGSFSPAYDKSGRVDPHAYKHLQWNNNTYLLPRKSNFPKRAVWGLIIWVGSTSKMSLSLAQTEMLRIQGDDVPDSERIIGWVATEEQYPCRANTPNCPYTFGYHWMMPSGKMFYLGGSGWGCAQRRQLRSMAHALLLFEPQFLLVVDDDTWVNAKQLLRGSPLSHVIMSDMARDAIVLGQLTGGNKVTRSGFFYGGAGYLMGPRLIEKLNAHVLEGPSYYADSIRDAKHMAHLGMMEEVASRVSKDPECADCMLLERAPNPPAYQDNIGALKVPLVELCTNLLSEEGTCYHSDHAMSVCLVHGAYAEVWNAQCWGYKTRSGVETGMCMGTEYCNTTLHLTCHRFMPDVSKPDRPPIAASARRHFFHW